MDGSSQWWSKIPCSVHSETNRWPQAPQEDVAVPWTPKIFIILKRSPRVDEHLEEFGGVLLTNWYFAHVPKDSLPELPRQSGS